MHTTICFINQKGGCGKSSSVFHLAGTLAASGKRVLIIDTDPQGSISQGFFGPELTHHLSVDETLAAVFDEEQFVSADSLVRLTSVQGIGVIPSNHLLSRHNQPSPENNGLKQFVLRDLVESISGWDFVLIDCPPNLYLCSWNAMIASDYVVIPVPPEDFGTQGIRIVHQAIASASRLNPGLTLLSHLVTRMDRRLIVHRAYETRLRESYGHQIFTTVIPELSAFKVALTCRTPVAQHATASMAAKAMRCLAAEIVNHVDTPSEQKVA